MDDVIRRVLDQMAEDTRQLLGWDAQQAVRLRREAGIYDLGGHDLNAPLCSGHEHDDDEADDFIVDD